MRQYHVKLNMIVGNHKSTRTPIKANSKLEAYLKFIKLTNTIESQVDSDEVTYVKS